MAFKNKQTVSYNILKMTNSCRVRILLCHSHYFKGFPLEKKEKIILRHKKRV